MPIPLAPGGKFYFPNLVFRLVRSNLPPHQAVFRTPQQLNKLDIKSYLSSLYSLAITDVRTMNYTGSSVRRKPVSKTARTGRKTEASYKKVIVTMESDFVFPDVPTVKTTGAMRIPPALTFGRNSGNRVRSKINVQATERGVDLQASQTEKQ
ncbi:hypothetical protein BC831DRAFT_441535 [Entophlyctis helioformis]|nr:hypothetical protein BC831DRAFT_441535 [Entophlyctis helioformis]